MIYISDHYTVIFDNVYCCQTNKVCWLLNCQLRKIFYSVSKSINIHISWQMLVYLCPKFITTSIQGSLKNKVINCSDYFNFNWAFESQMLFINVETGVGRFHRILSLITILLYELSKLGDSSNIKANFRVKRKKHCVFHYSLFRWVLWCLKS